VTFLGALLPGVREIRTPLAVGGLWLLCAALLAYPQTDWLLALDPIVALMQIVDLGGPTARFAGVGFAAYLVGILALGREGIVPGGQIAQSAQKLRSWTDRSSSDVPTPVSDRMLASFLAKLERPGVEARTLLRSTIEERLRPVSQELANVVPISVLLDEFELAGLRLSKDAPEQYQQYDRVRTEAQFRMGVSSPIFDGSLHLQKCECSIEDQLPSMGRERPHDGYDLGDDVHR
jgi:hypothetical protein